MTTPAARPRLKSITIADFRGIDSLEIEFPRDDGDRAGALVIAGDNGLGKTSVLEAILILFGRVDLLPADTASPRELVRQGASDFSIEGTLQLGAREERWRVNREELEKLDLRLRPPGASSAFGVATPRTSLDDALRGLQWGGPGPSHFSVEAFSARREPEDLGEPPAAPQGRRSAREERRLAELKRRLTNAYAKKDAGREVFARINGFLRTFMGDAWSLDVVFSNSAAGSDPVVVVRDGDLPSETLSLDGIRERAAYGDPMPRVIPIDRLSSGQMAILAMTYPFVFADRVPDLVVFDEPEQHLETTWQRVCLDALRILSPTTQFVVATHSPWVLDAVPSWERRQLLADDDPRVRENPGTAP